MKMDFFRGIAINVKVNHGKSIMFVGEKRAEILQRVMLLMTKDVIKKRVLNTFAYFWKK